MASPDRRKAEASNLEPNLLEKKDHMEGVSTSVLMTAATGVSGVAGTSCPMKRKADVLDQSSAGDVEETNNEAGGDDGDDSGDGNDGHEDEDDPSTEDCGSDWETDSFGDRSCDVDENEEGWPDEELKQQHIRYSRQVCQSKGFHVDPENIPDDLYVGVRPLKNLNAPRPPDGTVGELMAKLVRLTFDKYNKQKGTKLELVNVEKANVRMNYGPKYYITCMARETANGEPKEYQVKVEQKFRDTGVKNHYIMCRQALQP